MNRFKLLLLIAYIVYATDSFANIVRLTRTMCTGWGSACCITFERNIIKGNVLLSTVKASSLMQSPFYFASDSFQKFNKNKSEKLFKELSQEFNKLPDSSVIQSSTKSWCQCVYPHNEYCECKKVIKQYTY